MDIFKGYLVYNWALVLVLIAFIIMLVINVFLDKKVIKRMYLLIAFIFLLSLIVFFEFYLGDINKYPELRLTLTAIRYSSTPILIALICIITIKKTNKLLLMIPLLILVIVNIISIFTGIVFKVDENGSLVRGPLGYLPYIFVGLYSVYFVVLSFLQCNRQSTEIIPVVFMTFAFSTGLIFPFIIGKDYSKIFCTTVGIAVFVYYVFLILQLTKKDALTGLLNRQAYYSVIGENTKDITAIVSIDMNGLKVINDTYGHQAGDDAITKLVSCIQKSTKYKHIAFRIGGDEFIIICNKTSKEELENLIDNIKKNVSLNQCSCSIGYAFDDSPNKNIDEMVKISDEMMYLDKANYYKKKGIIRDNKKEVNNE